MHKPPSGWDLCFLLFLLFLMVLPWVWLGSLVSWIFFIFPVAWALKQHNMSACTTVHVSMYTSAAAVWFHMQCYFYAHHLQSYTSACLCMCVYMKQALKQYVCKSIHIQRIFVDVYENKCEWSAQLCTCIDAHGSCVLWFELWGSNICQNAPL